MKTLEIKDITQDYEEQRYKINKEIEKIYDFDFEKASKSIFYRSDSYKKLFCMKVKHNDGTIEDIKFGYLTSYDRNHPPIIIGSNCHYLCEEKIDEKIYVFCRTYKDRIFAGEDINDILKDDQFNILKYEFIKPEPNKTGILTKIFSKSQINK